MAKQAAEDKHEDAAVPAPEAKPHCGIIMPISDSSGYDPGHWLEVRRLIVRAAEQVGYTAGMVSENDGQDVIHRSIVKNIYHNDLVVCDVSSLNPNVMLELGLRMANKKPLIVIFDGEGVYPFDIKNMLYIPYPKGLHHFKVENFVQELTARMVQVTEATKAGKYEPFLNHFNDVVIEESRLGTTTQNIAETLASLVDEVKIVKSQMKSASGTGRRQDVIRFEDSILSASNNVFSFRQMITISDVIRETYSVAIQAGKSVQYIVKVCYDNVVTATQDADGPFFDPSISSRALAHAKETMSIIRNMVLSIESNAVGS